MDEQQKPAGRRGAPSEVQCWSATDRALEALYTLTYRQATERERAQVAQVALLAAQHRVAQLVKQKDEQHLA